MFIFGMHAEEVAAQRAAGIDMQAVIARSPILKDVLDQVATGVFSPDEPDRFRPIVDAVTHHDWFMVSADFDAYFAAQRAVDEVWHLPATWWERSILNTAHMGWFSADRAIRDYAETIWRVPVAPRR